MSQTLLPPNATEQARRTATTCSTAQALPVPIRTLWSADNCPADLLPYLAAGFSVDRWDEAWLETTKRQVIKSSYFVHSHKGTIGAIRRAVEPLGYLIRVLEWWQEQPPAPPGTFKIDVGVMDEGITEAMYQELERLIANAKPLTRHMSGLAISMEIRGAPHVGVAAYIGDELTVYPYMPETLIVSGQDWRGGALHTIDTMTINPRDTL